MDIGQKIREARKAKGLTLEALANQVGTDTGNLSRLERGKQGASQDLLRKIMGELDMTVSHIVPRANAGDFTYDNLIVLTPEENRMIHSSSLDLKKYLPRKFTVLSWRDAYHWATDPSSFFFEEGAEEHPCSVTPTGDAVWLRVVGDAMACTGNPSFPEGCLILVTRTTELINGKYYAFSIGESGDFTFKQYIEDAGYKYLKPLNNNYRTIELKDEHLLIGRIIDVKMTGL